MPVIQASWNIVPPGMLPLTVAFAAVHQQPLGAFMSKRSPPAAAKHARNAKVPAKAQRPKAAVPSSKLSAGRVVETSASELKSNPYNTLEEAAPRLDTPAAESQTAPRRENAAAALEDSINHRMAYNATNRGLQFWPTANIQAYQSRLLDFSLANMQVAFELAHRLATIKSPLDVFDLTAEFTGKQIALFHKEVCQTAS
jgi:hypothetical protein